MRRNARARRRRCRRRRPCRRHGYEVMAAITTALLMRGRPQDEYGLLPAWRRLRCCCNLFDDKTMQTASQERTFDAVWPRCVAAAVRCACRTVLCHVSASARQQTDASSSLRDDRGATAGIATPFAWHETDAAAGVAGEQRAGTSCMSTRTSLLLLMHALHDVSAPCAAQQRTTRRHHGRRRR